MSTEGMLPLPDLFATLLHAYGPQHWWPGETRLEIIVGAVLIQNTNWRNASRAIDNLALAGLLEWPALLASDDNTLRACIWPSGFYNVKLRRLRSLLNYLAPWGLEHPRWLALPLQTLRAELLAVQGVGPETADSILLYAFERPTFVVDAYTRRLLARLGADWAQRASYQALQAHWMAALPSDTALYNEAHALIVQHAKTHCRAKPRCADCPLLTHCPFGSGC